METDNTPTPPAASGLPAAHGSALAEVLEIAAALLVGREMPSVYIEDWDIAKTTPKKTLKAIVEAAEKCQDQRQKWAVRLRCAYDVLKTPNEKLSDAAH